jgi:UDP-N-acetylglucosamine acyltransferase
MDDMTPFMNQYNNNEIHHSNFIHTTSLIGSNVKIGKNNYIGPFCYIPDGVVIGDNNRFEAYCSIGTAPEHRDFFNNTVTSGCKGVTIGNYNIFREYVTINAGTYRDTQVGNMVIMLRGSHLGHDVIVEDGVTLSCNVLIGGESYIMEGVNMGLGSICHQYSVIGAYSMIGMGGVVTKSSSIIPGEIYVGNPVKHLKMNKIGLERNNIDIKKLADYTERYFELS